MKRILVIGTSGSGKSTLAKTLANKLELPFIATDRFYWDADWQLTPQEIFQANLRTVLAQDTWVMDGNFVDERYLVWQRADTIIWLDMPYALTMSRVLKRNLYWFLSRKAVWSGNKMTLTRACSGFIHASRSYGIKKKTYPMYLADFSHLEVFSFSKPKQLESWLKSI